MRRISFLGFKIHSVRHTPLTFAWVKLYKRPEVNSEPTHFLNNGKTFPSLHDITCSYQYQGTGKSKGIGFLETFKNPIHWKTILIASGIT